MHYRELSPEKLLFEAIVALRVIPGYEDTVERLKEDLKNRLDEVLDTSQSKLAIKEFRPSEQYKSVVYNQSGVVSYKDDVIVLPEWKEGTRKLKPAEKPMDVELRKKRWIKMAADQISTSLEYYPTDVFGSLQIRYHLTENALNQMKKKFKMFPVIMRKFMAVDEKSMSLKDFNAIFANDMREVHSIIGEVLHELFWNGYAWHKSQNPDKYNDTIRYFSEEQIDTLVKMWFDIYSSRAAERRDYRDVIISNYITKIKDIVPEKIVDENITESAVKIRQMKRDYDILTITREEDVRVFKEVMLPLLKEFFFALTTTDDEYIRQMFTKLKLITEKDIKTNLKLKEKNNEQEQQSPTAAGCV